MSKLPNISVIRGGREQERAIDDSNAINFAEIYPDNHIGDLEIISTARRLLVQALKKYNPEMAVEESGLRYISNLPDEYRHHPQDIYVGFRESKGCSYIIRFNRKTDGTPDLTINPGLDKPIKKINF